MTKLTKHQVRTYGPVPFNEPGYRPGATITAEVRHDDCCGNGHNSFAITAEVHEPKQRDISAGGCMHEEVAKYFPELAPVLKYHLMSTDEPLHYVANTLYWLGYSGWCDGKPNSPPNLAHARSSAVWPDLPEEYLIDDTMQTFTLLREKRAAEITAALKARQAGLMAEFQAAVESLGLEY